MSSLKAAAIGLPLITYVVFAWAEAAQAEIARFWWFGCGAATAIGFFLFRLSQRSEFGGDNGATEVGRVQRWVPIAGGVFMFCMGSFMAVWLLTSPFGDPWGAFGGLCLAVVGAAVAIHTARTNGWPN